MSEQCQHHSHRAIGHNHPNPINTMRTVSDVQTSAGQHMSKSNVSTGANAMSGPVRNVGHTASLCCAAPATQHSHYAHQTRRTASVCEDQHRNAHQNAAVHTHTLPHKQSVQSKPVANDMAQKQMSVSAGQQSNSQSTGTQPIRLQIDSLG